MVELWLYKCRMFRAECFLFKKFSKAEYFVSTITMSKKKLRKNDAD